MTALLSILLLTGAAKKTRFDEVTVQRINVVEPDGTLRMVISNHARLPGIIVHGKEKAFARPQAGMLFYDDEGSENGGLIFGGHRNAKGEIVDAGGSLSFDRFAGLVVTDSPSGTEVHRRVWVGREDDGAASVALMDGRARRVSGTGTPEIAFLDEASTVVRSIGASR
jgi:hypothetical protein